jgi:predicted nucleic acid-binding protein
MSEATRRADNPIVICDANVFYSIVTTDLVLSLGVAELFRPRWTRQIHAEWMRALLANRPDLDPAKIELRRKQMDEAIDDCLIERYEELISQLHLPDIDDRHVLAAAIHAKAQVILTYNHRHFPRRVLAPYGIIAQHPDDFLTTLTERYCEEVCDTLEEMRVRKTRPSLSQAEMLQKFANQKLPKFVAALRAIQYGLDS